MGSVLLLADHIQTAEIGARLQVGAALAGDHIVGISSRLSAVRVGKKLGLETHLIRRGVLPKGTRDHYHDHTFELRTGYLTPRDARTLHDSIVAAGYALMAPAPSKWSFILAWNGALVSSRAAETLSATLGIPVLYMEIANLAGRMVFDPDGSNCDASVAKSPTLLEAYPIDDDVFEKWSRDYVAAKMKQTSIPQTKTFVRPNFAFAVDLAGKLMGAAPAFSVGPMNRIANILKKREWQAKLQPLIRPDLPSDPFVFLPLQVSTDTNMVVRSTIDNSGAIDIAIDYARKNGLKVVAKIHPAEREGAFFEQIYGIAQKKSDILILSNAVTAQCITRAKHVITINSTVGFEARMLGTEATLLQPTLYSNWTPRQMAQFALRYTVPFDMYSTAPATKDQWLEILSHVRPLPTQGQVA